jgi:tellurite resistance protein TehA-like permease
MAAQHEAVTANRWSGLAPDVFSRVMATAIVSIAAFDHSYWRIETALKVVGSAMYALLGLAVVAGAARVPRLVRDLDAVPRMFTFVAASAVLAACWQAHPVVEYTLGGLAFVSWVLLVPVAVVRVRARPLTQLRDQARGAWLLPSVATQGLSITAADLVAHGGPTWLLGVASAAWLAGVLLYPPALWLIAWRAHSSAPPRPDLVTPDSWILMGALAIAALAGGNLVRSARLTPVPGGVPWWMAHLAALAPWIAASLWIPVLVYAQVWRADQLAGSLRYSGAWWSAVFPLGMYSSATSATGTELAIPALHTVSLVAFWIAFAVWTMVALGFLRASVPRWARHHVASAGSRRRTAMRGAGQLASEKRKPWPRSVTISGRWTG